MELNVSFLERLKNKRYYKLRILQYRAVAKKHEKYTRHDKNILI